MNLRIAYTNDTYKLVPTKIIALGLNYREHVRESVSVQAGGFSAGEPREPVLFPKLPSCLIGHGEPIIIPALVDSYHFDEPRTDYEAELALIIRDRCRNVAPENARDHIFGYTCLNDISQRNIQTSDRSGWFRGKSFDTFAPVGPCVVRSEDIDDPQSLRIQCRKNGAVVQDASTADMIFTIPEIVSYVSRNFTLEPGDIISTGTPAGVGPIQHGDTIEVEIESIGVLVNPVLAEALI